ncbi:hypothetical protein SAMN02745136_05071 [Anaerocolumna jejuensis DSM 15929]|uniref:Uncharacterized protein n=1 Tax=Anaerocolumna jejuensis DSM 15929 TaxID=1121322 RepID=A0A1M7BBD1_9FIRM|nr:hypothetical protein [Anaerocolumna jejuensis]SHL52335.1 hypothetical protein SAMN02745136_05071 [Anaerocolumna jejuensis DSM 15929]
MKIYYCDEWSDIKKKPWNIFDEQTACLHHQKKQPYTAILTEDEKPEYMVNVTKKWVSVSFYDERTRKYLNYDFEVVSDGKLFLRTAMHWEYDETGKELNSLIIGYREDGYLAMEKRDFTTGFVEKREAMDSIEKNWDVYPEFGEYLFLCRKER